MQIGKERQNNALGAIYRGARKRTIIKKWDHVTGGLNFTEASNFSWRALSTTYTFSGVAMPRVPASIVMAWRGWMETPHGIASGNYALSPW